MSNMASVGMSSWQPSWELGSPDIHHQQQSLGLRNLERQQQQQQHFRSVHSSVEFSGTSPSNVFHELTLPSQTRRLSHASSLPFRSSSKVIDLLAQDTTMAVDSKVYSLCNASVRSGNHLQPTQSSFVFANSGQNFWQHKELLSGRRGDTKVRAERVSRRPPRESSDDWQKTDSEDYREGNGPSMWDSNAENIRRRRPTRRYYPTPEVDDEPGVDDGPSPSLRERNWWSRDKEWDYESEPDRAEPKASQGWQWWFTNRDDKEEDEDDEEEDSSLFSWLNFDFKDAFMIMRWGLPAAFLLGAAVIPTMIGNPLMLLFGFTLFPTAVKFFSPIAKEFFRSVTNPFESSSSARRKRRNRPASTSTPRGRDPARYSDFSSPSRPTSRSYDSEIPRQEVRSGPSMLGGWDDLVEDRSRPKAESQWPLQRRPKSAKKLVRREQPLYIRLILAFFPFLRGWGGLL